MKETRRTTHAWSPESQVTYTRRRIERACSGNRPTLRAFADWLVRERGLGPGSVTVRLSSTCCFVDAVTAGAGTTTCARVLESLTPEGVEDFFVRYGQDHGMAARRGMRSAMRLFLKLAASRGWVDSELADAVPSLRSYRLSSLPRGLSDEQLSTLLSSPWEGRCPRRNRAIVYLLATYGVRRQQASALRLADIDWRERTIDFAAHKRGKAIHHTLTQSVAEALADYLRTERPTSDCEYVFLRQTSPYLRLGPPAITEIVGSRMVRCGLPRRGPHALRHTFATRLLQTGESVKAIADLLGHRSLGAVAIYAKVDYARLLECAVDWPEEVAS